MDNFPACIAFTFLYEGGFVNNVRDPGGATNMGITHAVLAAWRKKPVTLQDMKNLTKAEAMGIYKVNYWDHIDGDILPRGVNLMLLDIAVNMGVGRALSFQEATVNLAPLARVKRLDVLRCGFWRHLRIFSVFGVGWMRRETACLALATKMVST